MKWSKLLATPLVCPSTGEKCAYSVFCSSRKARIEQGAKFPLMDMADDFPDVGADLGVAIDVFDTEYCSELVTEGLRSFNTEGIDEGVRRAADMMVKAVEQIRTEY